LEIMCVKFGGIWCHSCLAVPEKLPKNGPKSVREFLTKKETENCSGQRKTLRFRFEKKKIQKLQ
jgi:hypothetical protein